MPRIPDHRTAQAGRRGRLGRADLLLALADSSVSRQTEDRIAAQLGLRRREQPRDLPGESEARDASPEEKERNPDNAARQDRPTAGFWLAETLTLDSPAPGTGTDPVPSPQPVAWRNRPREKPLFHPLAPARSLLTRLFHHVKELRPGRAVDVDAIVRRIGRGEPLTTIPRARRRSLGRDLCLIDDRHIHLTPYWIDHWLFSRLVGAALPGHRLHRAVLIDGHRDPWIEDEDGRPLAWQAPPEGSVVIVLSDLGALSRTPRSQVETWLRIGRRCQRRGCRLIAFIPCHPDDCDPALKPFFTLEPWETLRRVGRQTYGQRYRQAEYLLRLLAPAIRIEPGLLRAVRLALRKAGIAMDGSVEAVAWQHPAIREPSSVAATPDTGLRKKWLQPEGAGSGNAGEERHQALALALLRSWRAHLQPHVWFEELAALPGPVRALVPVEDLEDMQSFFRTMAGNPEAMADVETRMWLERLFDRLPEAACQDEDVGLRRIRLRLRQDRPLDRTSYPLDPTKLSPYDGPEQTGLVFLEGEDLYVVPQGAEYPRPVCFSPVALVRYKRPLIYTETGARHSGRDVACLRFQAGSFHVPQRIRSLPGQGTLQLVTDLETVQLRRVRRPGWATNLGRDRYGLFADLRLKGITYRCRWLPPGTFLMGSPESEPERWDDEKLHQVTLTRGFWLGETTVTQELWTAVMGENPSSFKGESRPVDSVSWKDCQAFCQRLQALPETAGLTFTLPTEAQWEYACRAGTGMPFAFGDNITPEQVNYDGNFPYNNGQEGEYREQTVAVKSLPCNDWGLYEMHGNVWEWCADWLGAYPDGPVQDPTGPDQGESRVLRGGSWVHFGRNCRSAFRYGFEPDIRTPHLGFRLSPGQSVR